MEFTEIVCKQPFKKMKPTIEQLKASVPSSKSTAMDWIAWDELNRRKFGKTAARNIFAIAARENGLNSSGNVADKTKIREATGYDLSDTSVGDSIRSGKDLVFGSIGDVFDFTTGISKVIIISTVSIAVVLVAGIAVRLIFLKPQDAGIVAGTAVKYAVKKG